MDPSRFPNLASPAVLRALLESRGIRPNRVLGQNFLIDRNIVNIILDAADLAGSDRVLEVGPGAGVLTLDLVQRAGRVLAVEKDHGLAGLLTDLAGGCANLEIRQADVLELDPGRTVTPQIDKVVSNLPYATGGRILVELTCRRSPPERLVVTVQAEVGDRLAGEAGDRARGTLGVWIQLRYHVERIKRVRPTCFWPRPDVQSVVVRLMRRIQPLLDSCLESRFYDLTRKAFQHRRKQMERVLNDLGGDGRGLMQAAGIDPRLRPEALAMDDWCRLAAVLGPLPATCGQPGMNGNDREGSLECT
ncbi:MAG: ribosomal RNA small subunit methyltransferase A [Lentisphaerae bacterium RIFOXYC12_FULL_60_16]|nr:MAG: ribosomal RNA small subunit methyltransferase A [Lentisphaerae bacterium RIFOXYC12_FULL_60_16]